MNEKCINKVIFVTTDYFLRTVEPPVSDHPKCKDRVVAYGRRSFTRIEPQGSSCEKRSRNIYFVEDNLLHAMSKVVYVYMQFHVVSKVLCIFQVLYIVHTAKIEIREYTKWSLTRGKNNGKSLTVRLKKWSRSLEVLTARLCRGKFMCFELAVVYGSWSLTSGGRTWRFDGI